MAIFGKNTTEDTSATPVKDEAAAPKVKAAKKTGVKAESSMKDLYEEKGTVAKTETKKLIKDSRAYRVLVRPLVTEKAGVLGAQNKYIFSVEPSANKIEVAKAIEEVYGVKPASVNMLNVSGKKTRYGRVAGKRKDWKKAIVTLPEGKTIKVYEGV